MQRESLLQALRNLTELYQAGGLTREEFQSTKEILLAQLRQLNSNVPTSSTSTSGPFQQMAHTSSNHPHTTNDVSSSRAPSHVYQASLGTEMSSQHPNVSPGGTSAASAPSAPLNPIAFEALDSLLADLQKMQQQGELDSETFQAGQQYLLQHLQMNKTVPFSTHRERSNGTAPPNVPPASLNGPANLSSLTPAGLGVNPTLVPGQTLLGRYYLEQLLGQGGMGQVFLCFDTIRQGHYALKVIHPHLAQYEDLRQRFLQELKVTERLTHPGIVRTYTLEQDPQSGFLFFTMEYVKGVTLETVLRQAEEVERVPPLPLHILVPALNELVEILEYAHQQGVIHRDLKPSNIMVGEGYHIKLMDFGIAKVLEGTSVSKHTGFGGFVYYMAPEQLRGGGIVSSASDVFSLGVISYQLLTGELPMGSIEPPSALWPLLPLDVDKVVLKAMSPRAHQRYRTPREFWEALLCALKPLMEEISIPNISIRPTRPVSLDEVLEKLQQTDPQVAIELSSNAEIPSQLAQQLLQDLSAVEIPDQTPYQKDLSALDLPEPNTFSSSARIAKADSLRTSSSNHKIPALPLRPQLSPLTRIQLPNVPEGIEEKTFYALDKTPLFQMVKIPAGLFWMGSKADTPNIYDNELPQRHVHLDAYWIARTPITHQIWWKFVQESGYNPNRRDYLTLWKDGQPPGVLLQHPVVGINVDDTKEFCSFYKLSLPTEAQWEKAARGTEGRTWSWGEEPPTPGHCNFRDSNLGHTTPVMQYPRGSSPYGLLDCCGNTWEWCLDHWNLKWLKEMGEQPRNPMHIHLGSAPPDAPQSRLQYSIRGGCYRYHARGVRCAFRFSASASAPYISFRVVEHIYS